MSGYTKSVEWLFEAMGTGWAVTSYDRDEIQFEETRKNGQEDCHMSATAHLVDGKWKIPSDGYNHKSPEAWDGPSMVEEYEGKKMVAAIEAYFDEHGTPGPSDG